MRTTQNGCFCVSAIFSWQPATWPQLFVPKPDAVLRLEEAEVAHLLSQVHFLKFGGSRSTQWLTCGCEPATSLAAHMCETGWKDVKWVHSAKILISWLKPLCVNKVSFIREYYIKPPVFPVCWQDKTQDDCLPSWIIPPCQTLHILILKSHWTTYEATNILFVSLGFLPSVMSQVPGSTQIPSTSGSPPWYRQAEWNSFRFIWIIFSIHTQIHCHTI